MTARMLLASLVGVASVFGQGRRLLADFAPPITQDPTNNYTAAIGVNYSQVQSFTETLHYDSDYNSYPDVYWFKYTSDGKTAVTFDTLGSNFGTQGPGGGSGGSVLATNNASQIAVYNSTGAMVANSKNTVDTSGNPIAIYPTFSSTYAQNWYTPEELTQLSFKSNAPSDPQWDANPSDPTPYIGWSAPGNAGNSQRYQASHGYYTNLNQYHVWSTALSQHVLNNDGSLTLNSSNQPINEPGWRYYEYGRNGPASSWNQYRVLPAGTYYLAVAGGGIVFSGDTYSDSLLQAPIHYDYSGNEPNNGSLPETTGPLGKWQYYDDPAGGQFYGTIQLNVTQSAAVVQYQWTTDANGNWSNAANWAGSVPHSAGDTANFLSTNTAPRTITLDAAESIGHLVFDSANQYTLAGSETLSMDNGSSPADLIVNTGSHVISAPLAFVSSTSIIAYSSTALAINGPVTIAAGQTVTKLGTGALTLSGPQTNAINSALYVGEGTATISTDPGVNLALTSAATVTFPASTGTGVRPIHLASLSITGQGLVNGTVTFAGPVARNEANRTVLVTSAVNFTGNSSLGWVGQLDMGGNDAIIHAGSLAQITNQLASGYNASGGGYWNGPGIISSAAAADPTRLTALGVIANTGGLYSAFDGQTVATTDLLIKYTYYGDADLNGKVDASDYSRIDNGFLTHATGWFNGDFNYDGIIDGSDYTLIDNAFNVQAAAITSAVATSTAQIASVPEPASLFVLSSASLAMLSRRQKK